MCDLEVEGGGLTLRDTQHRARKQRKCSECGKTIRPGQQYSTFVGLFEGDFFTERHCRRCMKARQWLGKQGHGWMSGEIHAWVRYCVETDRERLLKQAEKKRA